MSAVTARAVLLHSSWDTLLCETVTLTHSSCLQPGARGSSVQQRAVTNGPTAASPAGPQTSPLQKVSVSLLPPGLPGGVWRGSSGAGMEQTSPHICIYVPSLGCRETLAGMHSSVPTRCPRSRGPTRVDGGLFAIRRLLGRAELSTKGAHAGMQGAMCPLPPAEILGMRPSPPPQHPPIPSLCHNPRTQPAARSPHTQDFPACPSGANAFAAACGSPEPAWHRGKNDSSSPSAPLGAGWEPISASLPIRDRLTRISIAARPSGATKGTWDHLAACGDSTPCFWGGGGWCCALAEWHRLLDPLWGTEEGRLSRVCVPMCTARAAWICGLE